MVNPQELRIGNYVCYDPIYPSLTRINGLHYNGADTGYRKLIPYDQLYPVPLTIELLEKTHLRRRRIEEQDVFFNGDNVIIRVKDLVFYLYDESCGFSWNLGYMKHVHQLQNLYYAVDGIELEFEEK